MNHVKIFDINNNNIISNIHVQETLIESVSENNIVNYNSINCDEYNINNIDNDKIYDELIFDKYKI